MFVIFLPTVVVLRIVHAANNVNDCEGLVTPDMPLITESSQLV